MYLFFKTLGWYRVVEGNSVALKKMAKVELAKVECDGWHHGSARCRVDSKRDLPAPSV